jgi:hypothetical protein
MIIKKSKMLVLLLCLLVGLSAYFTNQGDSFFRYIKYLIFPIFLILSFFGQKIKISSLMKKNMILYSFLILFSFCYNVLYGNITTRFLEEVLLIMLPILTIIVFLGIVKIKLNIVIKSLFIIYIIVFVINNIYLLGDVGNLVSSFAEALKTSTFPTESWLAFPFGIFTIFFILEKETKYSILSSFIFLLCFKRITILGVFVSLVLFWFFYKRKKIGFSKNRTFLYFISLNITLLVILFNFINGNLSDLILKYTGLSANHFTQGRFRIYNDTLSYFSQHRLLGNGLGSTHIFLKSNFNNIHFLHSDILKLIVEFGIIPFSIWMLYFFRINILNKKSIPLLIFLNILFLSDNVFIYFDTLFLFYLVMSKYYIDQYSEELYSKS